MRYMIKAILASREHPEYGVTDIAFPIPREEYDNIIKLVEGDPLHQDCLIVDLDSRYSVLKRLDGTEVNVDELDYLAKRLDSFSKGEEIQFQAMASKLNLSEIKDFINLTFSCQQVTVITDFSDLEKIGKDHILALNGCMTMEEYEKIDGQAAALELLQSGDGTITPYGVVFDNGMKLEQVYDGRSFPMFPHESPLLTLGVPIQREIGGPVETAWLYLPASEQQVDRTLRRLGITNGDAAYFIEDSTLPDKVFAVLERPDDVIMELNSLCHAIEALDHTEREKLEAVVLLAKPDSVREIYQLAENLEQFDFIPRAEVPVQNSQINALGFVSYHGTLTLDELMQEDPAEQYQQEQGPTMGGFS